jgi:Fic family protein
MQYLIDEKQQKQKGRLYHKTQVAFAYNSNHIEGSRLTEAQTRLIFETRTIGFKDEESLPVDDIIETSNHFSAFDYMMDTVALPLDNNLIKTFHRMLKQGTTDAHKKWFGLGDWKKLPNEVGGMETSLPQNVETDMNKLNNWYTTFKTIELEVIVDYHWRFEKIHPFQDGNGRVGRLIMFRECLKNGIVPFIVDGIDERHKHFYYRGLHEFAAVHGYLMDTCLSAQDTYNQWVAYFYPEEKSFN